MRRLALVLEPTVVLDAERREVHIEERRKSHQTVTQVLASVQDWLEDAAVDSATVWLDGSRYTLARRPESTSSHDVVAMNLRRRVCSAAAALILPA